MSAAALQSVASAAAATIYDAIGVAETAAELDELVKLVWRGNLDGAIDDVDATHLVQYVEQRRPLRRHPHRQLTFRVSRPRSRICGASAASSSVAAFRSAESRGRRTSRSRTNADIGLPIQELPRHLAAGLTIADMAVMRIIADEYVRSAGCELSLAEIARSGGWLSEDRQASFAEGADPAVDQYRGTPRPGSEAQAQPHSRHFV